MTRLLITLFILSTTLASAGSAKEIEIGLANLSLIA